MFYTFSLIVMLFGGLANGFLGLVALLRDKTKRSNRWFFAVASLSSLIGILNFLLRITGYERILPPIWGIGVLMTFVGIVWLKIFLEGKLINNIQIVIFISLGLFSLIITQFPGFLDNITRESSIVFDGDSGPLFFVMLGMQLFGFIYIIYYGFKKKNNLTGVKKEQLQYVLLGMIGYGAVAILAGIIFPAIGFSELAFLDSPASLIWVGFTFYAIAQHRLMDIKLVILRTISYSLIVLVISTVVVGLTLLLPEALGVNNIAKSFIAILVSILIVLILDPLKKGLAKVTDKLFFKASIDYKKLLTDLSEIINREIDMDRLLFLMSKKVEKEIKLKNVSIYLASSIGGAFYKRKGRVDKDGKKITLGNTHEMNDSDEHNFKSRLSHDNPLVEYLKESNDIILLEALERKIEDTQDDKFRKKLEASKNSLDELDAGVVAPVNVGNNLTAVMVFGPKLSGDPFGSEDIELFKLIGPQLASALEKSRLYDEIKQFAERQKKEIALATEHLRNTNIQLQERNRFLAALQKVTSLMTETLDFNKVTQSIADSISTELGYLGGIVMFLGKDRHKLFPDAVTQTPTIKKSLKLLPKPYTEFYGDFRKDKSMSITAIKDGKVQIGHDLNDFIGPAIPQKISDDIQKTVGVKTIVAVPILSENKAIGVIDFLLNDNATEINESDLSIMKALANQTGIVSRNIELYKQVQDSNKELGEANKHLQRLDQAKSEFVSITSHQLRTPMTGIMGYLSMILQGDFGKVPKEQNKILTELLEESQRMIRIINLFLNVSKIESGKMELNFEEVQIEGVVERVIDMVKQAADEKGLKLIYKKPIKLLPKVWGDKDKLGDIVLNFTDNAIKYTEKGTVTLITEVEGKFLHFAVKDTGRGLDPEEAKKLFTKFVRGFGIAQVNPDGSGLGLYVARRLTEAHKGEIWVGSDGVGKGSTFQVKIPLANGQKAVKPKKIYWHLLPVNRRPETAILTLRALPKRKGMSR